MPQKDLTVTQDETFTGGLCLITMDPESNFILLEQLAQARDQSTWDELMAPALATPPRWASIALDCGYYDQAHLIHEFRRHAGMSPTRYLELRRERLNHPAAG